MKFYSHRAADGNSSLLLNNWRLIGALTLTSSLGGLAVGLATPNVYTSDARFLVPQSQSLGSLLGAPANVLAQLSGGGLNPLKNPNDLYVGMLRSRNVVDGVLALEGPVAGSRDEARERLLSATKVTAGKDSMVLLEVTDIDPKKASVRVGAYIENLKRLTTEVGVTEAAARRKFLEAQITDVRKSLSAAEDKLKDVQEATGLVDISLDAQADIGAAAGIQARIAAKEAEVSALRQYSAEGNPELKRALTELASYRATAAGLKQPALSGLAGKGQTYVRALRDVKYQEALFEGLSRQFELAKVDEAKQTSPVQVVDAPSVPDRKSGPKRSLIMLLGTFVGLLAAMSLVAFRENRRRAR